MKGQINKMMIKNLCLAAVTAVALSTGAAGITDSFDTAHDYAAAGTSGTIWDGFFYNLYGGDTVLAAADANISNNGVLTLRTTNGNWDKGDNDGVLLYMTVEGDFDARIRVVNMNVVNWHDAGLMARVADLTDAGAREDWVAVKYSTHNNCNGHRSTDNDKSNTVELYIAQPWLRLIRQGSAISSYRSGDGITWERIGTSNRSDMNGLALQVGIWQATFSPNEGIAQFDNFSLTLPTAWSNSAGGSWPISGNWTRGVPDGASDWISFPAILPGNVSVTLDGNQTAKHIAFSTTSSTAYSIDSGIPAGALTLDGNLGGGGTTSTLEVHSGTNSITAPVILSSDVTVSTAPGTGLKLQGGVTGNGGLVKNGEGTLTLSGTNALGNLKVTGAGALRITGGSTTVSASEGNTLFGDNVSLIIDGGALSITGSNAWLSVGANGGTATMTVESGSFSDTTQWGTALGHSKTSAGTLNVNGGLCTINSGNGLNVGDNGTATVNLNGGRLVVRKVRKNSGTGTFNFNGGTLMPTTTHNDFMTGLNYAYVKAGGAIIDSTNYNITVAQALLDGGEGGGLTKLGTGTLTLFDANTYSGATVVSNGVLQLTQANCLSTNTAVSVASGSDATINLAFTGTNTVRSLTLDGVLQTRNKVYNASNQPAALSGTGSLFVTEGPARLGMTIVIR